MPAHISGVPAFARIDPHINESPDPVANRQSNRRGHIAEQAVVET